MIPRLHDPRGTKRLAHTVHAVQPTHQRSRRLPPTSPQGTAVRKVIVFKRKPVQAPHAQVTDYLLLDDATGKEICAAHISEVQIDEQNTGAIVPKRIELRWPEQRLKLALRMDGALV